MVTLLTLALSGCESCLGEPPCLDCVLNPISPEEHTERFFPIAGGSPHDAQSCNDCHTQTTNFSFTCNSCHDHAQEVMDPVHGPIEDYFYDDGTACHTCHADGRATRDPNLDHDFPVLSPAVHGEVSCFACHRNPSDVEEINCIDCHDHDPHPTVHDEDPMAEVHGNIPDYQWASTSCLSCHEDGAPVGTVTHEVFFPIGQGAAHGALECVDCHLNDEDRAEVACKSCHLEETEPDLLTVHNDVGEFQIGLDPIDDPLCLRCHADSQVDAIVKHGFPVQAPVSADAPVAHHLQNCLDCHATFRDDKPFGAAFDRHSCIDCHTADGDPSGEPPAGMDVVHDGIPDYAFTNLACRRCHPNAEPQGDMDHEALFPLAPGQAHEGITCDGCHIDDAQRHTLGCKECHLDPDVVPVDLDLAHGLVGEFLPDAPEVTSADCARCHADSQVVDLVDHLPFVIDPAANGGEDPPHLQQRCFACHNADRRDKAWATDFAARQDCVGCHLQPDIEPTHQAFATYNYSNTACLTCHPDGKALSYIEHESVFPIEAPAAHAGLDCAECHIDNNDTLVIGCRECHVVEDDLDGIHVDVGEFSTGTEVDNAGCKRCHGDSQVDRIAFHTPFAIDAMIDAATGEPPAHYRQSCLACHQQTRADKPFAADFSQRACLGCHLRPDTDPVHAVVENYAYEDASCQTCHPDGKRAASEFDHTPHFPIEMADVHGDIACGACHINPTAPTQVGCQECHFTDPGEIVLLSDHGDVGEFAGGADVGSGMCKRCHADSQVDPVASHLPFEIQAVGASGGSPAHYGQDCTACHTSARADKPFATDFAALSSCTSCHEQVETGLTHSVIPGYAYDDLSCRTCHPDGSAAAAEIDHSPFFPIDGGATHNELSCAECHVNPADSRVMGCRACHEVEDDLDAVHGEVGEFQAGADVAVQDCLYCHADSQVHPVQEHSSSTLVPDLFFPINDPAHAHNLQQCTECHTAARADKPFARDFGTQDCVGCHLQPDTDPDHINVNGYSFSTPACLACHPSGGPAENIDHDPFFPLRAPAAHAAVSCGECHIDPADRSVLACRECHEATDGAAALQNDHVHVGEFDGVTLPGSATCARCHADSRGRPARRPRLPDPGLTEPVDGGALSPELP